MSNEVIHPISKAVLSLLRPICSRPDDLHVIEEIDARSISIRFSPHMSDIRLLIGRNGRQAKALNFLVGVMADRFGLSGRADIEESFRGEREERRATPANGDLNTVEIQDALTPIVGLALGPGVEIEVEERPDRFIAFVDANEEDVATVVAIADVFYTWAKARGEKLDVKSSNSKLEPEHRRRNGRVA